MSYEFASSLSVTCRTGARLLGLIALMSIGGCGSAGAPEQHLESAAVSQAPHIRYQVDQARNRVWLLTGEHMILYESAKPEKTIIDLPGWHWVDRAYGCLPDLALGPDGEPIITSNILPTLWKIDPQTFEVTVHSLVLDADTDKDVGFSGIVYSPEHGAFFAVSYVYGSLWKIDRLLRRAQKIEVSVPVLGACGLTKRSRIAQGNASRLTGLCVRALQGGWTIELAPDGRVGHVRAVACKDG